MKAPKYAVPQYVVNVRSSLLDAGDGHQLSFLSTLVARTYSFLTGLIIAILCFPNPIQRLSDSINSTSMTNSY